MYTDGQISGRRSVPKTGVAQNRDTKSIEGKRGEDIPLTS